MDSLLDRWNELQDMLAYALSGVRESIGSPDHSDTCRPVLASVLLCMHLSATSGSGHRKLAFETHPCVTLPSGELGRLHVFLLEPVIASAR